jgi:hypothetical protein
MTCFSLAATTIARRIENLFHPNHLPLPENPMFLVFLFLFVLFFAIQALPKIGVTDDSQA